MSLNTLLAASKLTAVVPGVEDIRDNPGQFLALSRVPFVPAEDGDITARVSSRIVAGDIYPDGVPAVVKPSPTMTLVPVEIANFKRAVALKSSELSLLARIVNGGGIPGDLQTFGGYVQRIVRENRMGNYLRVEQALWGMMLDAYSYTANGTTFSITFGKPSDLKVTPSTPWATSATATPMTDIGTLVALASDKYGVRYDRVSMGQADFTKLISTAQFQAQASVFSAVTFGTSNVGFPSANNGLMLALAGRVLGMEVEIVDGTVPTISNAGTVSTSTRMLPANKVVLSRKSDDNNAMTWDFANGTVMESIHAMISGQGSQNSNVVGGFGGVPVRGPVAFAFSRNDLTATEIHDVIRGFPRVHNTAATAVLTVG